jgi:hypothetical protein
MVLVEVSAARTAETRTRSIRMCQVRLLGIDPSGQPSSVFRQTAGSCCLGLCLFRACGHPLVQPDGLVRAPAAISVGTLAVIAHWPSPVPFPAALRS